MFVIELKIKSSRTNKVIVCLVKITHNIEFILYFGYDMGYICLFSKHKYIV